MNVLMIGNWKDGTGWGNACCNYILALDSVGVNVIPRAITYNNFAGLNSVPQRILELESSPIKDIDTVIQHCFPNMFTYQSEFKNIGMFYSETIDIPKQWIPGLSNVDQLIVPCNQMKESLSRANFESSVCGIPLNYDLYQNIQSTAEIYDLNEGSFNFCFVGELNKRKNLNALLKAYHSEFHPSENVQLFLQVNSSNLNSEETLKQTEDLNQGIIDGLKIRSNYRKIIISAGKMEHENMISILNQCHCYVCTSYGEAWCIPALECMAIGKPLIYTDGIGVEDFGKNVGMKVKSIQETCYGSIDTPSGIHTANDSWYSISIDDLRHAMRHYYSLWKNNKKEYLKISLKAKEEARLFNYNMIGKKLKDLICQ